MEQKIMEGNAKVVEFMGGTSFETNGEVFCKRVPIVNTGHIGMFSVDELKYHSSWDWLIPAWSKLYQLVHKRYLEFGESQARIWVTHKSQVFQSSVGDNNIMNAFNQLVWGIEWYNNHVSQNQTPISK